MIYIVLNHELYAKQSLSACLIAAQNMPDVGHILEVHGFRDIMLSGGWVVQQETDLTDIYDLVKGLLKVIQLITVDTELNAIQARCNDVAKVLSWPDIDTELREDDLLGDVIEGVGVINGACDVKRCQRGE